MWRKINKRRIYLDYAAATPVRKEVVKTMMPFWRKDFANPSAIYQEGVEARKAVEEARDIVARTLRVRAENVTFTSGGTESNNLAIVGQVEASRQAGVEYREMEIISTQLEHPSVLNVLKHLEKKGVTVFYAPVDEEGRVISEELKKLLSPRTRLITIAYANSETGVIQDINHIGRIVRTYEKQNNLSICFHSDACQAALWLPCALDALSLDAMSLDAGKFYGPKGGGVLIHRNKACIVNTLYGGSQEGGLRPGTENVPIIIGTAKALDIAQNGHVKRAKKVKKIRDWFIKQLRKMDSVVLNGSEAERLANNVNISIPGLDTEYAVIVLDAAGISVSTKSACGGVNGSGSYVVDIMTGDSGRATSTIRFTLGEETKKSDLRYVLRVLLEHTRNLYIN